MAIQIVRDAPNVPEAICPACKRVMQMDITPFQRDGITKPIKSKCPFCGADLFCALLILVDTNLQHLYKSIQAVVSVTDEGNRHLV